MCNHKLKRLFYTSDDNYDIQNGRVELEENDEKHTLSYCEKCGQVFVMEIAEKTEICVGDELEQITASGSPTGAKCVVVKTDGDKMNGIGKDGSLIICSSQVKRWWIKRGRYFPEVAELLKKMREEY